MVHYATRLSLVRTVSVMQYKHIVTKSGDECDNTRFAHHIKTQERVRDVE